ncbi:MAG TPA: hypothetical protein VMU41_04630 [Candidatus Binataceae bacterium]|nr:hypothetical protein [Candidatus Binataceae bacterium]
MRTLKLATLALALSMVLGAAGITQAQTSSAHQNKVWGLVRTQDHSTMNVWDKHVTIVVRPVVNDAPGAPVAKATLHHGHYAADMGNAPAGKYTVQINPGSTGYGAGQTLIDYPGPGGDVHQSFTLVLGGPPIPAKN